MTDRYALTDLDRDKLRDMHRWWEQQVGNPQQRPRLEQDDPLAPEVYVALAPSGGIPALSGSTPGSAECSIYLKRESGLLEAVTGLTRQVYNLYSAVSANTVVKIARDKFGTWWTDPPSSSSSIIAHHGAAAKYAYLVTTPYVPEEIYNTDSFTFTYSPADFSVDYDGYLNYANALSGGQTFLAIGYIRVKNLSDTSYPAARLSLFLTSDGTGSGAAEQASMGDNVAGADGNYAYLSLSVSAVFNNLSNGDDIHLAWHVSNGEPGGPGSADWMDVVSLSIIKLADTG